MLEDLEHYLKVPGNRERLLAAGPHAAEHVHLTGRLDHDLLRHLFPCCRVAVFPSIVREASPLVFAEALANGVVPAAADHSGFKDGLDGLEAHLPQEIWQHMKFDAALETRVQSVTDRVCALLAALDEQDLGPRLRELAEQYWDWEIVAAALAEAASTVAAMPASR